MQKIKEADDNADLSNHEYFICDKEAHIDFIVEKIKTKIQKG